MPRKSKSLEDLLVYLNFLYEEFTEEAIEEAREIMTKPPSTTSSFKDVAGLIQRIESELSYGLQHERFRLPLKRLQKDAEAFLKEMSSNTKVKAKKSSLRLTQRLMLVTILEICEGSCKKHLQEVFGNHPLIYKELESLKEKGFIVSRTTRYEVTMKGMIEIAKLTI
jgi:hypothetical protein